MFNFETISGILIALGTFYMAWKAIQEVRNRGDEQQTAAWIEIKKSLSEEIRDLRARSQEDRQRIRDLEASESAAKQQSFEDRQRIRDLERINKDTGDRLTSLEADHARVITTLKSYREGIRLLLEQLKKLSVDPAWTPPLD